MARDEGWLAEHMLILKLTNPLGERKFIAAAFPSACGKTNLAMVLPTIPGWKAETIGDDICWMGFDEIWTGSGPSTRSSVCSASLRYRRRDQSHRYTGPGQRHHLHQCRPDRRRRRLVGRAHPDTPDHLTDWREDEWIPASTSPAAHPNSRFTTPLSQVPIIAPQWEDPRGVPIAADLFGGRRDSAVPLVTEAFDWDHGLFLGATVATETTAAAAGAVGQSQPRSVRHAALLRLSHGRLLRSLAPDVGPQYDCRSAFLGVLLCQLVPPGPKESLLVARLRRELPGPCLDLRSLRRNRRAP